MDYKIKQKETAGKGMFFIEEDEETVGWLDYRLHDDELLSIDHTEVDPKMAGKGLASKLVEHTVEYARKNNRKVKPNCSYAAKQFARKEEYGDVLAKSE